MKTFISRPIRSPFGRGFFSSKSTAKVGRLQETQRDDGHDPDDHVGGDQPPMMRVGGVEIAEVAGQLKPGPQRHGHQAWA